MKLNQRQIKEITALLKPFISSFDDRRAYIGLALKNCEVSLSTFSAWEGNSSTTFSTLLLVHLQEFGTCNANDDYPLTELLHQLWEDVRGDKRKNVEDLLDELNLPQHPDASDGEPVPQAKQAAPEVTPDDMSVPQGKQSSAGGESILPYEQSPDDYNANRKRHIEMQRLALFNLILSEIALFLVLVLGLLGIYSIWENRFPAGFQEATSLVLIGVAGTIGSFIFTSYRRSHDEVTSDLYAYTTSNTNSSYFYSNRTTFSLTILTTITTIIIIVMYAIAAGRTIRVRVDIRFDLYIGPDVMAYNPILQIPEDTLLTVIGISEDSNWIQVGYENREGWIRINSNFMTFKGNLDRLPIIKDLPPTNTPLPTQIPSATPEPTATHTPLSTPPVTDAPTTTLTPTLIPISPTLALTPTLTPTITSTHTPIVTNTLSPTPLPTGWVLVGDTVILEMPITNGEYLEFLRDATTDGRYDPAYFEYSTVAQTWREQNASRGGLLFSNLSHEPEIAEPIVGLQPIEARTYCRAQDADLPTFIQLSNTADNITRGTNDENEWGLTANGDIRAWPDGQVSDSYAVFRCSQTQP